MTTVMLCGAADLVDLRRPFREVVTQFGCTPSSYMDASIRYRNVRVSDLESNSRRSVDRADLCVFVVYEKFGEITWLTEMQDVIASGKPFLLFCYHRTWTFFEGLERHGEDVGDIKDPDRRRLFTALEAARKSRFTVVPFEPVEFPEKLREHLSILLEEGLQAIAVEPTLLSRIERLNLAEQSACLELARHTQQDEPSPIAFHSLPEAVEVVAAELNALRSDLQNLQSTYYEASAEQGRLVRELKHKKQLPLLLIVGALILGICLGVLSTLQIQMLAPNDSQPSQEAPTPTAPSASPNPQPTPPGDTVIKLRPEERSFGSMYCASGQFFAFLGHWNKNDLATARLKQSIAISWRTYSSLRKAKELKRYPSVLISEDSDSCSDVVDRAYTDSSETTIYLWMGPFQTEGDARNACAAYHFKGGDCFPTS